MQLIHVVVGHWRLQVAFTLEVAAGSIGSVRHCNLLRVIRCLILDAKSSCSVVPFASKLIV